MEGRSDFIQGMKRDMYAWFFESYDRHEEMWPKIFGVRNSNAAWEQATSAIGVGELDEIAENEDINTDSISEGYTTYGKNRKFAKEIAISRETTEDHKIPGIVKKAAAGWGDAVPLTREKFYAKVFNNGGLTAGHDVFETAIPGIQTTSTSNLMYDGVELFNLSGNTRSSKGGGTYYNALALALSAANLQTLWNLMTITNAYNERDEEIVIMPQTLLIPFNLRFTAKSILESEKKPGSMDNDINVVQDIVQPVQWRYLTDTDAWFLLAKNTANMGLIALKRKMPSLDFYYWHKSQTYYAQMSTRFGFWGQNYRTVAASNVASS